MHPVLYRNLYVVKEHVGMLKAANDFDILDPETGETILPCREPNLGMFSKMFRFTDYEQMTPFDVIVITPSGEQVVRISRGFTLFLSKVGVVDEQNHLIGGFKQKFFSVGGACKVLNENDQPLCEPKGK